MKEKNVDLEKEFNMLQQSSTKTVEDFQTELHIEKEVNEFLQDEIIAKETTIGKVCNEKCSLFWPAHVTKLVLDLLDNGTRPSAIDDSIAMHAKSASGNVIIKYLPSETHIRRCRGTLRIIEELIAAHILGKTKTWKQRHGNKYTQMTHHVDKRVLIR